MDSVLHPELSLSMHQVALSGWWCLSASSHRTLTRKSVHTGGAGTQCKHQSSSGHEITFARWGQEAFSLCSENRNAHLSSSLSPWPCKVEVFPTGCRRGMVLFREQPVEAVSGALLGLGSTFLSVGTAVTCPGASRVWTSKARFCKVRRDVHKSQLSCLLSLEWYEGNISFHSSKKKAQNKARVTQKVVDKRERLPWEPRLARPAAHPSLIHPTTRTVLAIYFAPRTS